jgi:hypothetical protein
VRSRRRRLFVSVLEVAAVVAMVMAVIAFVQRGNADHHAGCQDPSVVDLITHVEHSF